MDSEYLLELKQITKYFPGVHALNGVSFGIRAGEVRAILGENGAGKSTLMNILYGYYQPSKGHLYWKGQEVKIEDSLKAQQLGISMVHQEGMLLQQMDVTSNIFLSQMDATAGFIHAKRMQQKAKKALEALGISHISPNSMVYDLSAADQKMVEIAKALSMQPRLLLLDEPTASLTEREIKMLFQTIRLLKQEGVAILYISHRLEEIFQIADSVTILRDGQHIISGDIQEFTMDSVILNMVGHSLSEQLEQLQQNRKDFSGGEVTISVESLSKKGKFQNISFSARKGEIFGISGLVGAGRTELLEAIYGFAPADSGAVKINGNVVQMKNCSAALKRGLALIPEERQRKGLFLQQSVQYNINIAVLKKYKKFLLLQDKQMVQDAVDGVAQLKINTPTIHKLVGELSGGNQQKCIVSRWLYTNPSILLLDEPTHGIDVGTKAEIYRIIRELADKGMTVLFVSSELNELLIMADRIMVMYEGTQRGILNRDEFSQEKVIGMASGIG